MVRLSKRSILIAGSCFTVAAILLAAVWWANQAARQPVHIPPAPGPALFHLVTSATCYAPCWHGIIPGQSADGDFGLALSQVGYVPFITGSAVEKQAGSVKIHYAGAHYQLNRGDTLGTLSDGGKIQQIKIFLGDNKPTLEQVMAVFGPPEKVAPYVIFLAGSPDFYQVYVLYPARGLWLVSYTPFEQPAAGQARLAPGMDFYHILLFKPGTAPELLDIAPYPLIPVKEIMPHLQRWKGFGTYQANYR